MAVDFAGCAAVGGECGAVFGVVVCAAYHYPVPAALAEIVVAIMAAVFAVTGAGAGDPFVVIAGGSVGIVVIFIVIVTAIVVSGLVCLFLAIVSRSARFALFFAFAKVAMVDDVAHSSFILKVTRRIA